MLPLGPFEPSPRLAVAVSGGADSLALALLAHAWATGRGGGILALVVDHGLRPEAAGEAYVTLSRLTRCGIATRLLSLSLAAGPGIAERARTARHAALEAACFEVGLVHLLYGHHAADQAETVAMRALRDGGCEAMPAILETPLVRRLRPLLTVPPERLKATLRSAGLAWVDDPSNRDMEAERPRLRGLMRDRAGAGILVQADLVVAARAGAARAARERQAALWLGRHATVLPEGVVLANRTTGVEAMPLEALRGILACVGGGGRRPPQRRASAWLAAPRPATLAGVQIIADGARWRFVREKAAMAPPVPAGPGARWDDRFELPRAGVYRPEAQLGAGGGLPRAAAARTLRALRSQHVACVLRAHNGGPLAGPPARFAPRVPLTPPPFCAAPVVGEPGGDADSRWHTHLP